MNFSKDNLIAEVNNKCVFTSDTCITFAENTKIQKYYCIIPKNVYRKEYILSKLKLSNEILQNRQPCEVANDIILKNKKMFNLCLTLKKDYKKFFKNTYNVDLNINMNTIDDISDIVDEIETSTLQKLKIWFNDWKKTNEAYCMCKYFTFKDFEYPFFSDWGNFFYELTTFDKKTLIHNITEKIDNANIFGVENIHKGINESFILTFHTTE